MTGYYSLNYLLDWTSKLFFIFSIYILIYYILYSYILKYILKEDLREQLKYKNFIIYKILYFIRNFLLFIILTDVLWWISVNIELYFLEIPAELKDISNLQNLQKWYFTIKYTHLGRLAIVITYWFTFYILLFNIIIKEKVEEIIKSEKINKIRESSKTIIVSISNSQIEGKIYDFDDEHLILKRDNEQIAVPWNEVTWIGAKD